MNTLPTSNLFANVSPDCQFLATPEEKEETMVRLYLAGKTTQEAAEAVGFKSRGPCKAALRKRGIASRPMSYRQRIASEVAAGLRTCLACGATKALAEFKSNRKRNGGVDACCKDCSSVRSGSANRHKPISVSLTEEQKAYLAGLLDGEGSVSLQKGRGKEGSTRGFHYNGRVNIGMTGRELVDLWKEHGFGSLWLRQHEYPYKPVYVWAWGAYVCRTVLPLVLPFVRFKKRQVEILIEYLNLSAHSPKAHTDKMLSRWERYDVLYKEMRELNRRGDISIDHAKKGRSNKSVVTRITLPSSGPLPSPAS